jgi:hypothetical protein
VASKKTPKEMFDALTRLYEGKESIKHMWQRKRNLLPQRKL